MRLSVVEKLRGAPEKKLYQHNLIGNKSVEASVEKYMK